MAPEYKYFEEQIFFSTLRIERPSTNSMGTGFLVEIPSNIEGKRYVFLISNKHILDDPSKETKLSLHLKDKNGKPLLGEIFNINVTEWKKGYYFSESPDVDLALLNVSELINVTKTQTGKDMNYRNLKIDMFSDYNEEYLVPGQKVFFIGYPDNRYDKKNFLPILRGGIIASVPKVDFEGKPHVLIDAQVFQGSSGSPVFSNIGKSWKFIGVVFQTMIKNQKVQIIETSKQAVTQEILGIGLIVKSTEVKKLVENARDDLDKINKEE